MVASAAGGIIESGGHGKCGRGGRPDLDSADRGYFTCLDVER